jgi:uncharacterized LabA/DUF88 family protein
MRTAIYIDGFNLYYWLKPTPYRWVDVKALALNAISTAENQHEIVAVKYFTAQVSDTQDDQRKSIRQNVYLRALGKSIPEFSVYYGEFRRQKKYMPRVNYDGSAGPLLHVWDTEEKGSDVNLAVELVNDAWQNLYDCAIVISNDSDLERAVKIAKKKGHTIGVLVRGDAVVNSLRRTASFYKPLCENDLRKALLPQTIPDSTIKIPVEWAAKEQKAGIR